MDDKVITRQEKVSLKTILTNFAKSNKSLRISLIWVVKIYLSKNHALLCIENQI